MEKLGGICTTMPPLPSSVVLNTHFKLPVHNYTHDPSLMKFCLPCVASIKRWFHGVEGSPVSIWSIMKEFLNGKVGWDLHYYASTAILSSPQHPFQAASPQLHSWSIPDEVLSALCGINKKMISWCRRISCLNLVHHEGISEWKSWVGFALLCLHCHPQ